MCKLKRALYGLRQSPRAWFERFEKAVTSYGYSQSQADYTMFYKHTGNDKVMILIVYVGWYHSYRQRWDMTDSLEEKVSWWFSIQRPGNFKILPRHRVFHVQSCIPVNQRKCILVLLKETDLLGCKVA